MRELSPTLLAAQRFEGDGDEIPAGYRKPYIELIFHNKDSSDVVDYSDRRIGIIHTRELSRTAIQRSYATIYLRNEDRAIQDLKGYWIEIAYGDYTTVGPEAEPTSRLWVKSQYQMSSPNNFTMGLELTGQEDILKQPCLINKDAPYHYQKYVDSIIFDIMTAVIHDVDVFLSFFHEDDGIIDTLLPQFEINRTLIIPTLDGFVPTASHETYEDVIVRLLWMTYQYLRAVPGQTMPWYELVYYPTIKGDREAHETYYSYQTPWFYEFVYRENLTDPNNFLVYCNIDPLTGLFSDPPIIGSAKDEEAYALYPKNRITWALDISQQGDANTRADCLLSRSMMSNRGGRLLTPQDSRVELLDIAMVYDGR